MTLSHGFYREFCEILQNTLLQSRSTDNFCYCYTLFLFQISDVREIIGNISVVKKKDKDSSSSSSSSSDSEHEGEKRKNKVRKKSRKKSSKVNENVPKKESIKSVKKDKILVETNVCGDKKLKEKNGKANIETNDAKKSSFCTLI